jgi:hypothetical protein
LIILSPITKKLLSSNIKVIVMYKKSIALLTIIMTSVCLHADYPAIPGSQANQGFQADHHHHHGLSHVEQRALEGYDRDIADLKKEIEEPHFKSSACWTVAAAGAALVAAGSLSSQKNDSLTNLGETVLVLACGMGVYTRMSESAKVAETEARIKDRMDRKDALLKKHC